MSELVEDLRSLIHLREYRAGERLPSERELAVHFEASRPRVRRAIATLVEHGVLEARDRSGVYVRGTDFSELLAARLLIEPWAAQEAARHSSAKDRESLRDALEEASASLENEVAFSASDRNIHDQILLASNNTVISELYLSLRQRISASRGRTASALETRKQSLSDLTDLVEAVERSDPEAAAKAMRRHLQNLPAQ